MPLLFWRKSRREEGDYRAAVEGVLRQLSNLLLETRDKQLAVEQAQTDRNNAMVAAFEAFTRTTDDKLQAIGALGQQQLASSRDMQAKVIELRDGLRCQLEEQLKTFAIDQATKIERMASDIRSMQAHATEVSCETRAEIEGAVDRCASIAIQIQQASRGPITLDDDPEFSQSYLAFEEKFRGSRDAILDRLRQYTPRLNRWSQELCEKTNGRRSVIDLSKLDLSGTPAHVSRVILGVEDLAAVDLGCGRGEWLDLLTDLGWQNIVGIDSSPAMIEECTRRNGLPAKLGDVTQCLSILPDNSLALVTGFHIVEHLPFPVLRQLLREVHRVLIPGGICIFETPNPENILTASQYFYLDPTHIHPLPPDLLRFVVEDAGFQNAEILRMQPNRDLGYVSESLPDKHKDSTVQLLLNHFRACRDYAVVGQAV